MEAPAARLLVLLWAVGAAHGAAAAAASETQLVNEDVKRTVDLSSHLAKVTADVLLAHPGGSAAPVSSFVLALEPVLEARLAHLGVQLKGEEEEENHLEVREIKLKGKRYTSYPKITQTKFGGMYCQIVCNIMCGLLNTTTVKKKI
uniref:Dolichyl-diphosphooligosaccharide--protein glycosyltransferase subunit 1 n=1 Tax=Sarcophilus harrisii TaxID=9305 RepID=A0A7N4NJJ0_SARHA